MSDDRNPSPSGETWVCRAAKGYTRCDILPCTVRSYPEHKRCGPVPSSDTPSDERACERPGCGHPMDDHDGEHGCEDCVMCPAYVPPIGSRLHGQWAGSNEDPVRWCALCGTWEDEADWITHSGHASLFPTDDVRHADAVTAEPEWSTRPVPSSDTPSDERRPVDVTALPEWRRLVKAEADLCADTSHHKDGLTIAVALCAGELIDQVRRLAAAPSPTDGDRGNTTYRCQVQQAGSGTCTWPTCGCGDA